MTPTEKDAMALAVLDETIRRTEAQMPTPSNRRGESTMHPCHFVEYLHDIKQARAHLASRIGDLTAEIERLQQWLNVSNGSLSKAEAELAAVRDATCKVAEEMEACAQCSPSAEFYGMRFGDVMLTLSARLTDAARGGEGRGDGRD